MKDLAQIDAELRLISVVRRSIAAVGGPLPRHEPTDELLDVRLSYSDEPRIIP